MNKALRVILPILLVVVIVCSLVWYLMEYDPSFTRDTIMSTARAFDNAGQHRIAAWLYDMAYLQSEGNDEIAIELAEHYKSNGNYTKAEYTLSGAIADGGTLDLYIALCQTYVEQDKLLDAVNMLNNITNADIKAQIELVRAYSDEVEKISKEDTVGYRDKLEAKIRDILDNAEAVVDENRLLTECAIWADKIAIDEELVRLRSHFGAFYDIAAAKEPSGRKLDFLMQELNRETNTIGSKANNARIARIVVNMKGELEKIREQVQNIE